MGRENLDDYQASFPVLLETWEAAEKFVTADRGDAQPIDIARLLGWTRVQKGHGEMTHIARACNAAHKLIAGGYLERETMRL